MTIQLPRSLDSRRIIRVLAHTLSECVVYRDGVVAAYGSYPSPDDARLIETLDREINRLNSLYGCSPAHVATCLGIAAPAGSAETAMDRLDP